MPIKSLCTRPVYTYADNSLLSPCRALGLRRVLVPTLLVLCAQAVMTSGGERLPHVAPQC